MFSLKQILKKDERKTLRVLAPTRATADMKLERLEQKTGLDLEPTSKFYRITAHSRLPSRGQFYVVTITVKDIDNAPLGNFWYECDSKGASEYRYEIVQNYRVRPQ